MYNVQYVPIASIPQSPVWQSTTTLPNLVYPVGRALHQTFIYKGNLYVLGGWYGDGQPLDSDVEYAPILSGGALGSFVQTTSLPFGMCSHSTAVSEGGIVYLAYGTNLFLSQIAADGSLGSWIIQPTVAGMNHNNAGNTGMAIVSNLLVIVDASSTFVCQLSGSGQIDSTVTTITNPITFPERSVYTDNGKVYVAATTGNIYRLDGLPTGQATTNLVLSLNGSNSYVTVSNAMGLAPTNELTIEFWAYVAEPQYGYLLNKGDDTDSSSSRSYDFGWHPNLGHDLLTAALFLGQNTYVYMEVPFPRGQWLHYAMTFDSAKGVVMGYVNGLLTSTINTNYDQRLPFVGLPVRQTQLPLLLGRNNTQITPGTYFNGYIDEVRIWSKARTPQEIYENMFCRLTGTESNLVGYWNFDNGTVSDLTGQSENDTLAGGVQIVPIVGYDAVHAGVCGGFTPNAATASAVVVSNFVVGATLTAGGYGYTNTPSVRIIGGGGSGARAVAVLSNGVVIAIDVLDAGSGYTNTPLIVIAPPFIPNPILDMAPMSLLTFSNLALGGVYQLQQFVQGYFWTNQAVSFAATNSVNAQMVSGAVNSGDYRLALSPVPAQAFAVADVDNGFVVGATITTGGSGYVTNPAVSIVSNGGGTNAGGFCEISGGVVTSITITNAGLDYTNTPTIEISPPPAAAVSPTVQLVMRVDSASLAPYDNYQIQFKPDLGKAWGNWNGGLFSPTDVTNSQYLFVTNASGFFRLKYVP